MSEQLDINNCILLLRTMWIKLGSDSQLYSTKKNYLYSSYNLFS